LPRSTKSKRVNEEDQGAVATLEREEEVEDVTSQVDTDTDIEDEDEVDERDTGFTFESFPAPPDFEPEKRSPGRSRQPSYFDNLLRDPAIFGSKEWQMVPVTSQEHAEAVIRELNRARMWCNNPKNPDVNPDDPDVSYDHEIREDAVYWKSRVAQKRERKSKTNGSAADAESDEYEDEDSDNE
jgi:hypothetical protein